MLYLSNNNLQKYIKRITNNFLQVLQPEPNTFIFIFSLLYF